MAQVTRPGWRALTDARGGRTTDLTMYIKAHRAEFYVPSRRCKLSRARADIRMALTTSGDGQVTVITMCSHTGMLPQTPSSLAMAQRPTARTMHRNKSPTNRQTDNPAPPAPADVARDRRNLTCAHNTQSMLLCPLPNIEFPSRWPRARDHSQQSHARHAARTAIRGLPVHLRSLQGLQRHHPPVLSPVLRTNEPLLHSLPAAQAAHVSLRCSPLHRTACPLAPPAPRHPSCTLTRPPRCPSCPRPCTRRHPAEAASLRPPHRTHFLCSTAPRTRPPLPRLSGRRHTQ
jgi:hypothetical protein